MQVRKTLLRDGDGLGARRVWWWILPRWQPRHLRVQAVSRWIIRTTLTWMK
jgi:hypothetical protein